MLKKLRIERFKSIYDQDIEFGRVNLFIGTNGSGKSNILEALGVLSAALSNGLDPVTLDLKGVRLSLPHIFKSAFKGFDLPKTFRLEATFQNGRYETSIRASPNNPVLEFHSEALYDGDKQVFGRSSHGTRLHSVKDDVPNFSPDLVGPSRSVWSAIEPFVKISPGLRDELDEFAKFAIYAPQTAVMRGLAIDPRVVEPLGLTGSGLASAFGQLQRSFKLEELQKLVDIIWEPGWADMVRTGSFQPDIVPSQVRSEGTVLYIRDKFMQTSRNMLSAFDASEGTLYLIFVATLLQHAGTPKVFALDNVDGTLNPKLVRKLSKHVIDVVATPQTDKRQTFMTSHHPSSLDSFDIFDSSQRIFVCYRSPAEDGGAIGRSIFRPLLPPDGATKDSWTLMHRGKNLSELLLDNRIERAL